MYAAEWAGNLASRRLRAKRPKITPRTPLFTPNMACGSRCMMGRASGAMPWSRFTPRSQAGLYPYSLVRRARSAQMAHGRPSASTRDPIGGLRRCKARSRNISARGWKSIPCGEASRARIQFQVRSRRNCSRCPRPEPSASVGRCVLRSDEPSVPAAPASQRADAEPAPRAVAGPGESARFLAVQFVQWPLDVTRVALWRALHRLRLGIGHDAHAGRDGGSLSSQRILGRLASWPTVVVEGLPASRSDRTARIIACCPIAAGLGLKVGMTLAQAEAVCPRIGPPRVSGEMSSADLTTSSEWTAQIAEWIGVRGANAPDDAGGEVLRRFIVDANCGALVLRADEGAWGPLLRRLAVCLERWVPRVAVNSTPDLGYGLLADLEGCAALFRMTYQTEQALMRRIGESFGRRGFTSHLATASTIGAASALARHGRRACTTSGICVRAVREGARLKRWIRCRSRRCESRPTRPRRCIPVEVRTVGQLAKLRREGVAARLAQAATHGPSLFEHSVGDTQQATGRVKDRARAKAGPVRKSARRSSSHGTSDALGTSFYAGALLDDGAVLGGRGISEPLHRLDQALGRAPEALVPLRMQEPLACIKTFEGPASNLEAILVACGELLDELVTALEKRREGMRLSRWIFRHCELPADLSTDALGNGLVRPVKRGNVSAPSDARIGASGQISELLLRLSAPSMNRVHLWNMLRPKLEHLPLDHGIEEIEVRLEEAARVRTVQWRLSLQRASAAVPAHQKPKLAATLTARDAVRMDGSCTGSCAGAVLASATTSAGWIPAQGVHAHISPSDGDVGERACLHPDDRARMQEWIDLVAARIGADCVHRTPPLIGMRDLWSGAIDRAPDGGADGVVHLGQRPSQYFRSEEPAILVGGGAGLELAACMAERRAWRTYPTTPRTVIRPAPVVDWRGQIWSLSAIDGWERVAPRWWEPSAETGPLDAVDTTDHPRPRDPAGRDALLPLHADDRASPDAPPPMRMDPISHLSGRLHARIQIGSGLWLYVRFPSRLAFPESPVDVSGHDGTRPEAIDPWCVRCGRACSAGIRISVLGAWG